MNEQEFRLSVSKTKTFLGCKKQYKFSYILKMPKKERDYHVFGTFAHKILENFHNYYLDGSVDPYNKAMTLAFKNAYQEYQPRLSPEMKKEGYELANKYLKIISTQKDNPLAKNVIACEKNFSIKINDNVLLNGMIDRIQLDDDNVLHVGDYKTTKNKKYLVNDFFQLLTYGYALVMENPDIKKIRASYILLRHNFELVTTEFDIDQILEVKNKYEEYANKILMEKEFPASPTKLCEYCDYLDICEEGLAQTNSSKKMFNYGETDW